MRRSLFDLADVANRLTRREFLRLTGAATGIAGAAAITSRSAAQFAAISQAPDQLDPNKLAKFVDRLPIPSALKPRGFKPSPDDPGMHVPYYRLAMRELTAKVHRDLKPTRFWGFGNSFPGPIFETRSGKPLMVEWANELPVSHFLPIDHNVHGAEANRPAVRTTVHLHGAKVPSESDGYPEDWYVPGKSKVAYYPNNQEACMLWYHDHAMGITRLNMWAGLMGAFFIRDEFEDGLNLPKGKYEIPLVLCDRILDQAGQLYYPVSDNPKAPWVPEFNGNALLANGKLFPYLDVEPRKYRFRIVNASNATILYLIFGIGVIGAPTVPGVPLGQPIDVFQIGTDQGLLPAPAPTQMIALAPGERTDVVVDFAEHRGGQIILQSGGRAIVQFRVRAAKTTDGSALPPTLRPITKLSEASATVTRTLTLDMTDDKNNPWGMMNPPMLLNNAHWRMPVTEKPRLNSVEIWNLVALTGSEDMHPIHLHLVRFQILDRRQIDGAAMRDRGVLEFGPPIAPRPGEAGWKDTVIVPGQAATRIIIPFEGFAGRYVWHCHILEHEDNEMMRPYDVVPE